MNKGKPIKCVFDIRNVPPSAYVMPDDGRKAKHMSRLRRDLVWFLASYANPDGTSIRPSRGSMAAALGIHVRTVSRLLVDLKTLGFLSDAGWFAIGETHLRNRTLNVAKIQQAAGTSTVPDTSPTVPNSDPLCQIAASTVPNSYSTQPPFLEPPMRPPTQPAQGVRKDSLEAWLDKEAQAADTLEEALRHVPEYMQGSGFKHGEEDRLGKLIAAHGWEEFVAVAGLYGQKQDPTFFDGTTYKWSGLLPNFLALLDKVTPEMLRAQSQQRWKNTPAGAAEYQRQTEAQVVQARAAAAADWDAKSDKGSQLATGEGQISIADYLAEP